MTKPATPFIGVRIRASKALISRWYKAAEMARKRASTDQGEVPSVGYFSTWARRAITRAARREERRDEEERLQQRRAARSKPRARRDPGTSES